MRWLFKTKGLPALFLTIWGATLGFAMPLPAETTVFAAASLRGVLDELASQSDSAITLSYAGSGTIARQVASGAPADVVILAHPVWMDWLKTQNLIRPNTDVTLAENSLVVIGPKDSAPLTTAKDLADRLGQDRIAMGQRDAVPAGIYAKEWLQTAGLWEDVQDRLAETDNVRAALAFVARGETPFGIVYATDALADAGVDVLYQIPPETHAAIRYPAASLTEKGDVLVTWLQTPQAQEIFAKHGFRAP